MDMNALRSLGLFFKGQEGSLKEIQVGKAGQTAEIHNVAGRNNNGTWYQDKERRRAAMEKREDRRRDARKMHSSFEKRASAGTVVLGLMLTGLTGYAVVETVNLNRRLNAYDGSVAAAFPCQDGNSKAHCIPIERENGTWIMGRLMADGTLVHEGPLMDAGPRLSVTVLEGERAHKAPLAFAPVRGAKGMIHYEWVLAIPQGSMVPLLSPDGKAVMAPAGQSAASVDLSRVIAVSGRILDDHDPALVSREAMGGPQR